MFKDVLFKDVLFKDILFKDVLFKDVLLTMYCLRCIITMYCKPCIVNAVLLTCIVFQGVQHGARDDCHSYQQQHRTTVAHKQTCGESMSDAGATYLDER